MLNSDLCSHHADGLEHADGVFKAVRNGIRTYDLTFSLEATLFGRIEEMESIVGGRVAGAYVANSENRRYAIRK